MVNKMSKHTPGPWKLYRIASDVVFVNEDRIARGESIPAYNRKIAEMPNWSDENYDEKMANARLITAAPELLEELKIAVMNCPCSIPERDSGHLAFCRAPIWNELIAKAEGTDAD